jgi:hypothetical protein
MISVWNPFIVLSVQPREVIPAGERYGTICGMG